MKKLFSFALFIALGFLAMRVPFSQLVGAANVKFSLFDFYGPIAGGFLGSIPGLVTVAVMQLINWGVNGFSMDTGVVIRLFPMLFAVIYFAKKEKLTLIVTAIAMVAFWAHPEGRQAWYYALYWTIPFIAYFFHDKFIFARALGSTFTAHAVGGALWIWAFNMKAGMWIGLIPIVWKERFLMALGITLTFMAMNYILSLLEKKAHITLPGITLHPKYSVK